MKFVMLAVILLCLGFSVYGQSEKMVGKKSAPHLKLATLDGKTLVTADLIGKVVVYNFWYIGCPPCRAEIPELNAIVEEYKGKDVVFIGLTTEDRGNVEKFLKDIPFSYQIVPAAGQTMLFNYGNTLEDGSLYIPFPTHIVVNRKGFIEVQVAGKKGVASVRDELKRQFAGPAQAGN